VSGQIESELVLARQPRDQREAKSWLDLFSLLRYTVSVGLMQINVEMTLSSMCDPNNFSSLARIFEWGRLFSFLYIPM
jgi:hypothetical protein